MLNVVLHVHQRYRVSASSPRSLFPHRLSPVSNKRLADSRALRSSFAQTQPAVRQSPQHPANSGRDGETPRARRLHTHTERSTSPFGQRRGRKLGRSARRDHPPHTKPPPPPRSRPRLPPPRDAGALSAPSPLPPPATRHRGPAPAPASLRASRAPPAPPAAAPSASHGLLPPPPPCCPEPPAATGGHRHGTEAAGAG